MQHCFWFRRWKSFAHNTSLSLPSLVARHEQRVFHNWSQSIISTIRNFFKILNQNFFDEVRVVNKNTSFEELIVSDDFSIFLEDFIVSLLDNSKINHKPFPNIGCLHTTSRPICVIAINISEINVLLIMRFIKSEIKLTSKVPI